MERLGTFRAIVRRWIKLLDPAAAEYKTRYMESDEDPRDRVANLLRSMSYCVDGHLRRILRSIFLVFFSSSSGAEAKNHGPRMLTHNIYRALPGACRTETSIIS